jgi:hypothetical protein
MALGLVLVRYFGLGLWTLLDASIVVATSFGLKGYLVTRNYERLFSHKISGIIFSDSNRSSNQDLDEREFLFNEKPYASSKK